LQVFALTSAYDNAIYSWLAQNLGDNESKQTEKRLFLKKQCNLRYGENPHQYAEFYHYPNIIKDSFLDVGFNSDWQLAKARQLQGKELSYNNYLDLDAAWAAVREFGEPTVVIVKHLTPCGIASADSLTVAYQKAWNCDTVSAFGGVMAFNQEVPASLVQAIINNKQFIEALVAPAYEPEALELLASKANARVLVTGGINPTGNTMDIRSIEGGMLVMNSDAVREDYAGFTVPTLVKPDAEQLEDLMFAWRACKSVKSNAIVIASDKATVGIGAGQPNRVNSAELAVRQAGDKAIAAVAASDAFMPFADSLQTLAAAGVKAIIQPGGSMRDEEVIEAANLAGISIVFTGVRHFRH
jgi:phosphoribosylaminoimidazolecarboxamide formyltransferase/IMP cyclohydrolase